MPIDRSGAMQRAARAVLTDRDRIAVAEQIIQAVRETAQECVGIAQRHQSEWIRPSEGAAALPVGSHACVLVIEEIRRTFGLGNFLRKHPQGTEDLQGNDDSRPE